MQNKYILKFFVLLLAVLQPLTAYFSSFGNRSSSSLMDQMSSPTITPAGYAFSIWGVICIGSLVYAVYQVATKRNQELYNSIALYAIAVFTGFSVWLYVADKNLLWLTVVIFVTMGYFLYKLFPLVLKANNEQKLSLFEKFAVYGTFGLYAGWTTVAIFANIASAVKFYGVSDLGTFGILWQTLVLASATIVSYIAITKTKASLPYTLTILWAFVAVLIATIQKANIADILPWVSGLATGILLFQYIRILIRKN